jgi:hypothetical protein
MSGNRQRLIEIVDKLPPERIIELVEFAEFLESQEQRDVERIKRGVIAAYSAFRDALPSTEEFEAMKRPEIQMENGRS